MKKNFLSRIAGMLIISLLTLPGFAKPFCLGFTAFTLTPNGCSGANLSWSYDQCSIGKYYVMYSSDNMNYYPVGVADARNTNNIETYAYTDPYACPTSGTTYYCIKYIYNGTTETSLTVSSNA